MLFVTSSADSTGHPPKCESQQRICGSSCQYHTLAVALHHHCGDSCCLRCASTIEQTVNNQVQKLLAGRDLAQELQQISFDGRLSCLPLTGSGYRFLLHQFRIVLDYLSEHDTRNTGQRWGAVFHLRLIGARIRNARKSSTWVFQSQLVDSRRSSDCCCSRWLPELA